jgi:hypothetical protein
MKSKRLLTTLVLGVGLTMALLWLLSGPGTGLPAVRAADLHVCPNGCAYSSIQAAVDAASDGDVIKVATGTYTGVSARAGVTQVVYINKSVTIQGGYTTAFTEPPNPKANSTTLDAREQGRVLYITGNISPTVEGLRITGGYVKASGGGIYNKDADLALINTIITNNISSGINWPDGLGGGMYIETGSVVLSEVQIISNSASYKGGGMCVWGGSVTLNGGQIINNTANGPTYWDGGGGMFVLGSATLSGGQIISNSASHGGGLYVYLSNVTLSGVQIIDNSAAWAGGGVFIWPGGGVTLSEGQIISNTANYGGGVHSGGTFTLTNNMIAGNQANTQGAGLWFSGWLGDETEGRLLHNTIADNLGCDQGVYVGDYATLAFTNTIIAGHSVGITNANPASSTVTANYTLLDNTTDYGDGVSSANEVHGDPAFGDPTPGVWDYHLTSSSAAVDAGVDAGVTDDIDGHTRPFDGDDDGADEFDIGADEYVKWHIYLPLVLRNH